MGSRVVRRAMPDERTVIKMRQEYFIEGKTYKEIAEWYGIGTTGVRNAILGNSWFYAQIKDNIPEEVKEARRHGTKA